MFAQCDLNFIWSRCSLTYPNPWYVGSKWCILKHSSIFPNFNSMDSRRCKTFEYLSCAKSEKNKQEKDPLGGSSTCSTCGVSHTVPTGTSTTSTSSTTPADSTTRANPVLQRSRTSAGIETKLWSTFLQTVKPDLSTAIPACSAASVSNAHAWIHKWSTKIFPSTQ